MLSSKGGSNENVATKGMIGFCSKSIKVREFLKPDAELFDVTYAINLSKKMIIGYNLIDRHIHLHFLTQRTFNLAECLWIIFVSLKNYRSFSSFPHKCLSKLEIIMVHFVETFNESIDR